MNYSVSKVYHQVEKKAKARTIQLMLRKERHTTIQRKSSCACSVNFFTASLSKLFATDFQPNIWNLKRFGEPLLHTFY